MIAIIVMCVLTDNYVYEFFLHLQNTVCQVAGANTCQRLTTSGYQKHWSNGLQQASQKYPTAR